MAEKIYLITGKELASYTKSSQEELVSLFERVTVAYPDATMPQIIASVRDWISNETPESIDWDYSTGNAVEALELPVEEETNDQDNEPVEEETPLYVEETETVEDFANDFSDYDSFDLEVPIETTEDVEYENVEFLTEPEETEIFDIQTETVEEEPDVYEEPQVVEEAVEEEFNYEDAPTYEEEEPAADEEPVEQAPENNYNEEELFANQNPVISRQKRYRGLLAEAAKLDRN